MIHDQKEKQNIETTIFPLKLEIISYKLVGFTLQLIIHVK